MACCISSRETNACTAPDSVKPSTSAHSVAQNMKKPSVRLSPMVPHTPMSLSPLRCPTPTSCPYIPCDHTVVV